jgi:hypothetical protein
LEAKGGRKRGLEAEAVYRTYVQKDLTTVKSSIVQGKLKGRAYKKLCLFVE